ncbi:MAG TPA: FecR domain-containing protein [Cyclobacteriaceae bacterium]|nr:FecR domain-containing protein [Cyclobacteriaceae bacterium]
MEKSDFDRLLQRYLTGQVSDAEKASLEAWLEVMKTENTTNLELTPEEEQLLFQKITATVDSGKPVTEFIPNQIKRQRANRWFLRVAASILLLMAASFLVWQWMKRDIQEEVLAATAVDKMILNDGSLVWVKGSSKLAYFEKDNGQTRYAELTGEALFEVAKDPNRPFVIQCREVSIKVLGTSFNLRANQDSVVLKVLTGKVTVSAIADNKTLQVEPFQEVIYTRGHWKQSTFGEKEATAMATNTEYDMRFENNTLGEVLARLESKFDVRIKATEESAKNCRLTADLTDHSLETSLQLITEVLTVTVTKQNSTIVVNGKGCL